MARIKLELPEKFLFETEMCVRITDINYGGHMGNDASLSIIHEARMRFLKNYGFSEMDVGGVGIIMSDAVVCYKSESFYGDELVIQVAVGDVSDYGCDLFYKITNKLSGKEVVRAKTGIVFFDYPSKKIAKTPAAFIQKMDLR